MDAIHSGTGVFYQAMPAVGADGKNIMKLIPVQMVNGQSVHIQMSNPKKDPTPQTAATMNIASAPAAQMVKKAALNHFATQQVVRKQVSFINSLSNQGTDLCNSLSKQQLQQQAIKLMAKVPLMATPATNCEMSGRLPSQLPVTVKSPALPRGQHLQIPTNAQVRTVPASSPGSGLRGAVYVSPVMTVNQGATQPSDSALHSLNQCSKTYKTSCGASSKGSKPHLKLIPQVSQRPNSPMKWMIEEEDGSAAPTLDPLISTSVTSEILRAVAERENSSAAPTLEPLTSASVTSEILRAVAQRENSPTAPTHETYNSASVTLQILKAVAERENVIKYRDVVTKPVFQLSQGKSGQGQENALVMCNGKVFFVAKKCSRPHNMGEADTSQQSLELVAPEIRQNLRIIIPDGSDEVIDLCGDDDDAQDVSSQEAASVKRSLTHLEEDNVIFVSYIPPKSKSGTARDLIPKTQMALSKETDQVGTSSSYSVSLDGTTGGDGRDEIPAPGGRKPGRNLLVSTAENRAHVCGSAVVNTHDDEGSNINSQQSISTQQVESIEVDVETGLADPSISDITSGIYSGIQDTHKMQSSMNPTRSWSSSLVPKSSQMADHLIRQIFRITADVKICLRRIDEVSAGSVPAVPRQSESIRSVEDHQEPTSGLKDKDFFPQHLCSPQENDDNGLVGVKRVKILAEQELSADAATPSPHTHIGPLSCSHFKLNAKPLSALECNSDLSSLNGTSCDVRTEPAFGYVEPIDEDFLSADENDIPNSQDTDAQPQTSTCVDLNTNTRRMARARKRTVCPCCIPGTQDSSVKLKSAEPEKWAWMTEQKSKKGGRTKAVRKDVKTSGSNSCLTAKNNCETCKVPASDSLPTTSVDSAELKRHEQIKRLKELLKEKEAALELMRNSTS